MVQSSLSLFPLSFRNAVRLWLLPEQYIVPLRERRVVMRANIPPTAWSLAARVAIAAYNTLHREQHVVLNIKLSTGDHLLKKRTVPTPRTHAATHTHMHPRTHTDTPGNQVPGVYASVHMSVFLLSCELRGRGGIGLPHSLSCSFCAPPLFAVAHFCTGEQPQQSHRLRAPCCCFSDGCQVQEQRVSISKWSLLLFSLYWPVASHLNFLWGLSGEPLLCAVPRCHVPFPASLFPLLFSPFSPFFAGKVGT